MNQQIPVSKFYGKESSKRKSLENTAEPIIPFKSTSLLDGPTLTWKVFRKQAEALSFMRKNGFGLMTFAFQTGETRYFLTAHPEVFWHYDSQRSNDQRCSYEVIPEGSVCKLYLDLEYNKEDYPNRDENITLDSFIQLICFYLKKQFSIHCDRKNIIILDSSTTIKFSAHVIFDLPSICFLDNYNAGNFIKYVCSEIINSYNTGEFTESLKQGPLNFKQLNNFIIKDSKGIVKLFCDECVYSKNRHFCLFKSTKKGKNAPLVLHKNCHYKSKDEKVIFLSSLISYVKGSENTKVLQYGENNDYTDKIKVSRELNSVNHSSTSGTFPKVDNFINSLISPTGKIYRSVYFSTSNVIVYDIIGYRYCANIGREHKSNNVKYIVDLVNCHYYQKCYDYECSNFRSERINLPYDVSFSLSDNSDLTGNNNIGVFDINLTADVLGAIEDAALDPTFSQEIVPKKFKVDHKINKFPSFGLPDESFSEIADVIDC